MGIYFDTARIVGVRLLHLIDDAWFVVKEHMGPDFQHIYDSEFGQYVGNSEYRVEWAHPATTTFIANANANNDMVIWTI